MTAERRVLRLTPDDQAADRYHEVPFELTGAASVEVRIEVEGPGVIDLGCLGPAGWRGWSGGARRDFVIAPDSATPGYLPGPLEDGRWAVVLGLHQLPAEGVEIRVEILTPATGPAEHPQDPPVPADRPAPGSARALPAPAGLTWFAGDLHAHTVHSDGSQPIGWLAAEAALRGLDFTAVTDHNTVSHHAHLPGAAARYGVGLLPGQEVTTARGHANAYGDIGWIDFRRPAATWVEEVERRGGLLSINHAIDRDCAWQHPLPQRPRLLEAWHTSWFRDLTGTGPWAFGAAWGEAVPVGGSDFHRPGGPDVLGRPTTWVAATDPSPDALLAGLRAGRTAVTAGPSGPVLLRVGESLLALDAADAFLVDAEGRRARVHGDRAEFRVDADGPRGAGRGPYRLETTGREVLALTA